jgi:hypothetical protein
METISIKDGDGKVYEFEKPEFECELLKTFKTDLNIIFGIGYTIITKNKIPAPYPYIWDMCNGICYDTYDNQLEELNLTPIKPKWHEDESNYPAVMYNKTEDEYMILKWCDRIPRHEYWELATKQECDSLFCEE